jgi:hypothetical protein
VKTLTEKPCSDASGQRLSLADGACIRYTDSRGFYQQTAAGVTPALPGSLPDQPRELALT